MSVIIRNVEENPVYENNEVKCLSFLCLPDSLNGSSLENLCYVKKIQEK